MAPKPDPTFTPTKPAPVQNSPDAYASYSSEDSMAKKHPVVPELASYGLTLITLAVAAVLFIRLWRSRNKSS